MDIKLLLHPLNSASPPGRPNNSSLHQPIKHTASPTPLPEKCPADKGNKQKKWHQEDDKIVVELRDKGLKWDDVANHFPGRSSTACRLRYQNYLEKQVDWGEEKKNKLARLYARYFSNEIFSENTTDDLQKIQTRHVEGHLPRKSVIRLRVRIPEPGVGISFPDPMQAILRLVQRLLIRQVWQEEDGRSLSQLLYLAQLESGRMWSKRPMLVTALELPYIFEFYPQPKAR